MQTHGFRLQLRTIWRVLEKGSGKELTKDENGNPTELPYDSEKILKSVRLYYDYAYLPVESNAKDVTQLEAVELQKIMGKKTIDEIVRVLEDKSEEGDESIIESINKRLSGFLSRVNHEIGKIDKSYKYKTRQGVADKLKSEDICRLILEEYLSKRTLKQNTTEISELSSGEQRRVLMDVLYAFLTSDEATSRNVILGIDEPESSMHTSICFEQFQRAFDLANKYNHQVLLTTHWYGFLPHCQPGNLHYINLEGNDRTIESISLSKAPAERRKFPSDIEFKSYFDLVSSILSVSRSKPYKWVFCEGVDDALYLHAFLNIKSKYEHLRVVPLGGATLVVKIFGYVFAALADKTEEKATESKFIFLYDTDKETVPFGYPKSESKDQSLIIRRLQISRDKVTLERPSSVTTYHQTELEDCLASKPYYESVIKHLELSNKVLYIKVKELFEHRKDSEYALVSELSNSKSFLKPIDLKGMELYDEIYQSIMEGEQNKLNIARLYCEGMKEDSVPAWVDDVIKLLGDG